MIMIIIIIIILNFHVISYKIYHTIMHLISRGQRLLGLSVKIHRLFN